MIRIDKIQAGTTGLFGWVGFRNSTLTGYDIVDATNQGTNPVLYFQDGSKLVSIKNIKDSQENPNITTEQFNTLLGNMQKSVILDVCNEVIKEQPDFVNSNNLYPFEKSFENTIGKTGKFVGFEITPNRIGNVICKIPWVETSFDGVVTFNLYLYNSNLPTTPIQTKAITTVAGASKITILDWIVADDATYKGGVFYLGYFDDDLTVDDVEVSAYKKDYEISNVKVSTPYYSIQPISLSSTDDAISIVDRVYESDTFGLNIGINLHEDYTEMILRNRSLFYNAIQLQMHKEVLGLIKYSTRININESISKDVVDFELYGNSTLKISGVLEKLNDSISTIRKSLFRQPRMSKATLSI
jgi:hypothetical protein